MSAEHLPQLPQKESINKDLCCAMRRHAVLPTLMLRMNKSVMTRNCTGAVCGQDVLCHTDDLFVSVTVSLPPSAFWLTNAEPHIRSGVRRIQGAVSVIGVWQHSLSVSYSRHHVGHVERPQFVAAALFVALGSVVLSPRLVSAFSFCLSLFNFPLV